MRSGTRAVANYVMFVFLFAVISVMFFHSASDSLIPSISDEVEAEAPVQAPDFVIDPGHGGEDGGAEAGGILEKDLNLSVSFKIADICTIFGYDALLTRDGDRLLYDEYGDYTDYTGKKKTFDLRNRLRKAEESGAGLFIGVHMNKFPEAKYKGLQVYYSPNDEKSKNAAEFIRSYSKKYVDPANERECKKAGKSIYILNRIDMPAVLVECGFISNEEERALLTTPEYQSRLAAAIFASCAEFVNMK